VKSFTFNCSSGIPNSWGNFLTAAARTPFIQLILTLI
jgi:hypothetical protein